MLLLIILLLLLLGGGGSYWAHGAYGPSWGIGGGLGTILLIIPVFFLLRGGVD